MLLSCVPYSCITEAENSFLIIKVLISLFLAVLFLQSGWDKVTDRKGNSEWLTGHFSNSPLKNMVPFMLGVITLLELASGILLTTGVTMLLLKGVDYIAFWGTLLSSVSLLLLFFGQRMTKDYAGAATLVSYFILSVIGLYLYL